MNHSSDPMAATQSPDLVVRHDPGRTGVRTGATALAICLVFLVITGVASPTEERPYFAIAFILASVFWIGWIIRAARGRNSRVREFHLEEESLVCRDGTSELWREPLRGFRKLCWEEQSRPNHGRYGGSYRVHVVTLVHPNPDHNIEIFAHQNPSLILPVFERWAGKLGLPVSRPAPPENSGVPRR